VAPWTWYVVRDASARLDAVALVWPVFGAAAVAASVLAAALLRSRRLALVAVSWAVALLAVVVGPWRPLDTGTPVEAVRVVATNVYANHTYPPGVLRQIEAQRPDVLVVSEVVGASARTFGAAFRYAVGDRVGSDDEDWRIPNDVAVFSDLPMDGGPLPPSLRDQRGLRAVIDGPGGRFVLYALHLQKPGITPSSYETGFRTQRRLVDRVAAAVEAETLPVVVAGDLNLSDRTSGYRALTDVLDDAMRAGWAGPTSLKRTTRLLLARIDHILVPEDWCSADSNTFTMRGSDHRGVAATVGRCR
jgi:endonuclease/exonuclease/phosphatase (EEP) superfamily protein YafD